jgi:type II secretory pathway pseudopilin PulG
MIVRTCKSPRRRAFSLVEVLVVVGTIGILAALLLPALARARVKSRAAQCTANLRQWGIALRLYADDNADFLPRRGQGVQPLAEIDRPEDWFNALPPYLGLPAFQVMIEKNQPPPAHAASPFICPPAENPGGHYFLPYGMNMNLCPWNLPVATKFSDVPNPTVVVAMADAPGPYASTFPSARAYSPAARHASRVNLLFLAGQVQSFTGAQVGCGVGDPHVPDISWLTGTTSDASVSNY